MEKKTKIGIGIGIGILALGGGAFALLHRRKTTVLGASQPAPDGSAPSKTPSPSSAASQKAASPQTPPLSAIAPPPSASAPGGAATTLDVTEILECDGPLVEPRVEVEPFGPAFGARPRLFGGGLVAGGMRPIARLPRAR